MMQATQIIAKPLTAEAFAAYGDVIECGTVDPIAINQGRCDRFHHLAEPDIINGTAGISLFQSQLITLPYRVWLLERHPLGSQAFIPMQDCETLVVVADDKFGAPVNIAAFLAKGHQGINIHRNVWHGVLAPMSSTGLFAVIDRIGDGSNLEEHHIKEPAIVVLPETI